MMVAPRAWALKVKLMSGPLPVMPAEPSLRDTRMEAEPVSLRTFLVSMGSSPSPPQKLPRVTPVKLTALGSNWIWIGAPMTSLAPSTCSDMVKLSDRLFSSWVASKRTAAAPPTGRGAPGPVSGGAVAGGPNPPGAVAGGAAGATTGLAGGGVSGAPGGMAVAAGASFGAAVSSTGLGP